MHIFAFLMGTRGSCKYLFTRMINIRQHSLALMEHSRIEECLSVYAMLQPLFNEVFMDDFSVYGKTFADCLANLEKVLTKCSKVDLVLNWEKCHFMVKQGIVFGHMISERGIEGD